MTDEELNWALEHNLKEALADDRDFLESTAFTLIRDIPRYVNIEIFRKVAELLAEKIRTRRLFIALVNSYNLKNKADSHDIIYLSELLAMLTFENGLND